MRISVNSKIFTQQLLLWNNNANTREMPWKGEKNPYKIWLSEIILQQTRVEQGTAYYYRFIEKFPTIQQLALAPEDEVFKLWEGLGYYTRCKNLIATARIIAFEMDAIFPNEYASILALKGIGPYTAAAIASFAFNLPHAVVDGNVTRVISRFLGLQTPIDTTEGKKEYARIAQTLVYKKDPGTYNQAIMDFGATICKPQVPLCQICPLQKNCVAFAKELTKILPVKNKKPAPRTRYFYYLIINFKDKIYVRKRTEKDIWQSLWEFVLIEKEAKFTVNEIIKDVDFLNLFEDKGLQIRSSPFYKQQLTHQTIEGVFIFVKARAAFADNRFSAVKKSDLKSLAFPRFITRFLELKDDLKVFE